MKTVQEVRKGLEAAEHALSECRTWKDDPEQDQESIQLIEIQLTEQVRMLRWVLANRSTSSPQKNHSPATPKEA